MSMQDRGPRGKQLYQAARRLSASRQEARIAALLAENWSRTQIAQRLGIVIGTVNTYAFRLYQKLNVTSVGDLTRVLMNECYNPGGTQPMAFMDDPPTQTVF